MKKLFIILFLFSCGSLIHAQWVVNGFESAAADSIFFYAPGNPGLASGEGSLVLTDVTDPVHSGSKAMKADYIVHSSESYGGYTEFQLLRPQDTTYFDWSHPAALRLWYYVLTPFDQGNIYFRFKILESGGNANYQASQSDHEDWYFQGPAIYGAAPGWNYIDMPLVDRGSGGPNAEGFSLTGWSGTANNTKLDFDKIVGWMVDFITDGISGNGKGQGSVVFDDLEFLGNKYTPVETFENTASGYWTLDKMEWAGGTDVQSDVVLTDKTGDDAFEGSSSLQLDLTVNTSQSWGGYVNMERRLADGAVLPDMSSNAALYMYIKVLTPFSGLTNRVTMRLFLYDGPEWWQITVPVNLYETSDWQLIKLPLVDQGYGAPALRSDGFVVPSWSVDQGHGEGGGFNLSNIVGYKIEFSAEAGTVGDKLTGSIMVDLLTPGGYQETDKTPPEAPTGILGINDVYTNLITWNDVAGESQETYNVFYSLNPLPSSLPNFLQNPLPAGVELVKTALPEGEQLVNHILIAPNVDQEVTYYYGVNAVDKAGNFGAVANSQTPITNTARGVPTIHLATPQNFVADGDLSEWAGITPIHLSVEGENPTAYAVTNTTINGDADLMVDAYIATDENYLYAAFDIQDDAFRPNSSSSSWLNDCPDLFIGLYDWHGAPHGAYRRGSEPDYHVRYAWNRIVLDGLLDSLLGLGENYYYGETFTGYIVESRIPYAELAALTEDAQFVPKEGMRIPWDFEINDNDNETREGQMDYSKAAEGNSYSTTARWTHTWIGNKWFVGVNDNENKKLTYNLEQNYPNPFNPSTQIAYSIEKSGQVTLRIFDVLGREVKELVNKFQNAGTYTVDFNASGLSTGMYIYQINVGNFQSSKKMLLVK